jgi:hypothetical protein
MACKKDITPTKSNLMIGSIDYSFGGQNSNYHSNYSFEYSENNILKKVNLEGVLVISKYGQSPFVFTTKYRGNIFELDKNIGVSEFNNYNGEDQSLELENDGRIKKSIYGYALDVPSFGILNFTENRNFVYANGNLSKIFTEDNVFDSLNNFIFSSIKLSSFNHFYKNSRFNPLVDSTITFTLGYQNSTPDTSVIKVNGINNLILCIPFEVQETLPFLVVDERLSLTGKKQNYLINSISVEEKRGGVSQKTTTYTINYLYDLEGRITHVQWINNATLAIYREAVIGYL